MSLIFISHSSQDRAAAEELRDRLFQEGHSAEGSVFLDFDPANGIKAGQDWEQALYRNIRACRAVIVLCSRASMASRWCFMEITYGRALGKQIFPVKIEDCDLDGILSDHQVVDLSNGGEEGYRRLFRGVAEAGLDPSNVFIWDGKRPPYPGLLAFQEADAPLFFGREDETDRGLDLLNRIRRLGETNLVMVLGASGSGKSSVVRAGLLPRLRRDVERWLVLDPIRPRSDPALELSETLSRAFDRAGLPMSVAIVSDRIREATAWAGDAGGKSGPVISAPDPHRDIVERLRTLEESLPQAPELQSVRRYLRLAWAGLDHPEQTAAQPPSGSTVSPNRNPLLQLTADLLRANRRDEARVLLIIDQFEELLDHEASHPANAFLRLLGATMQARADSPLLVLGTMRSDFLGIFQECPALLGVPYESLLVGPLRNLSSVIAEPAKTAGIELESGLVESLVADAKTGDALPLLAFALRELYDRVGERHKLVTVKDYDDLGRLEGAVAKSAGHLIEGLDEDQKARLRRALLSLARITDEGNYARRSVRWSELDPQVHPILEKFVEARLLISGERDGGRILEVAHEALFRSWETLRQWLNESAEALRLRKDLEGVAPEWNSSARSPEYLWSGGRLARALELSALGSLPLNALEQEFLDASRQAEQAAKAREEARRKRQLRWVLAFAATVTFLLLGAVYLYVRAKNSQRDANVARYDAEGRRIEAEAATASAKSNAAEALARQLAADSGVVRVASVDSTLAALLGIESLRRAETVQGFEALWKAGSGLAREISRSQHPETIGVHTVAFSPDGTLIAEGVDGPNEDADAFAQVFDARTGRRVASQSLPSRVNKVVFSPDGTLVAVASGYRGPCFVLVFNARNNSVMFKKAFDEPVRSVAFNYDGTLVAAGSKDKTARILSARNGHELSRIVTLDSLVPAVAFSPDGKRVAAASGDVAVIFGPEMPQEAGAMAPGGRVMDVAFSPDGALVAVASTSHVEVSQTQSKQTVASITDASNVAAFSPDGTFVATGSGIRAGVFEARSGREVVRLPQPATTVAFSPQGKLVATNFGIFEALTGREAARFTRSVEAVAFSPDGKLVAAAFADGTRVFQTGLERDIAHLPYPACGYGGFSPGGDWVASCPRSAVVLLFDGTGREVSRLAHAADAVEAVAFSLNGAWMATGSVGWSDSTVRVFETGTRRKVTTLAQPGVLSVVALSPDGTLLAAGSNTTAYASPGMVHVYDARTGKELARQKLPSRITAIAFSPDGHRLAAGSTDIALVFDAGSGRPIAQLKHPSRMTSLAFSPDGMRVATGAADKTARLFDAGTGNEVFRLALQDGVTALAFNREGTLLAAGSRDGAVRVVEPGTGQEVARLALGESVRHLAFVSGGQRLRAVTGEENLHVTEDQLHPVDLIADTCSKLDRNLTREEWADYLGALPYRESCSQLNPAALAAKRK